MNDFPIHDENIENEDNVIFYSGYLTYDDDYEENVTINNGMVIIANPAFDENAAMKK